jgi:hypothetical protein
VPPGPRELPDDPVYEPDDVVAASVTTSRAHTLALEDRQLGEEVRTMGTRALRDEIVTLEQDVLRHRPRAGAVAARGATERREAAEAKYRQVREQLAALDQQLAAFGRLGHRAGRHQLQQRRHPLALADSLATERLNAAVEQERTTVAHERQRAGWDHGHRPELRRHDAIRRELAWRQRAAGRAAEGQMPQYLVDSLGPRPESVRGARRWRQLAAGAQGYRREHGINDPVRALGPEPKTADLTQRHTWRRLRRDAERLWDAQHAAPNGQTRLPEAFMADESAMNKGRERGVD